MSINKCILQCKKYFRRYNLYMEWMYGTFLNNYTPGNKMLPCQKKEKIIQVTKFSNNLKFN